MIIVISRRVDLAYTHPCLDEEVGKIMLLKLGRENVSTDIFKYMYA